MELTELEPREQLSALLIAALGGGDVAVAGRTLHPFDGWAGPLSVAADASAGLVYAGAGPGGGPRVAVLDAATGERARPDFFAFEPAFGGGVRVAAAGGALYAGPGHGGGPVLAEYDGRTGAERGRSFVGDPRDRDGVEDVAASAVAARTEFAPLPGYAVGDAAGLPLYVAFEVPVGPAEAAATLDAAWSILSPVGGLYLTTARPAGPAGNYPTVRVQERVYGPSAGEFGYAPLAGARLILAPQYFEAPAYARWTGPAGTAVGVAHEYLHLLGLGHTAAAGNVMGPGFSPANTGLTAGQVADAREALAVVGNILRAAAVR